MFIRCVKRQSYNGARLSQKLLLNTDHIIAVEELACNGTAVVTCTGITEDEITTFYLEDSYEWICSLIYGLGGKQ